MSQPGSTQSIRQAMKNNSLCGDHNKWDHKEILRREYIEFIKNEVPGPEIRPGQGCTWM